MTTVSSDGELQRLHTEYLPQLAWLSSEAVGVRVEYVGGGLTAIVGDVAHVDGLTPAREVIATNSESYGLSREPGGPWLVGLYDGDGDVLSYGAGPTLEMAHKTAVAYLVAGATRPSS